MNLVGKIFIVLIFVMSLVWMGFSVAVYATHRNWREIVENDTATADKPLGLRHQLQEQEEFNDELKDRLDKASEQLATEQAAKRQALTKLETEKIELERQRDEQAKEIATLVQSETDAVAALKATQEAEAALRKEVVDLRDQISQAQEDRDKAFDEAVALTDKLHQAANEYRTLRSRVDELTEDLAKANEVLRKHGLKPEPALYEGVPPIVEGVVLNAGSNGLVEISIGSDDGLMKGHRLEVVRQSGGVSSYVGRIEVVETAPDKAVCKVLPQFLQRSIERNDRVTSKLNQ
jgi:hypothetical protein